MAPAGFVRVVDRWPSRASAGQIDDAPPDAPADGEAADHVDKQPDLDRLDSLVQGGLGVLRENCYRFLSDDRAGVDTCVNEVDGAAGYLDAVVDGLANRMVAPERPAGTRLDGR